MLNTSPIKSNQSDYEMSYEYPNAPIEPSLDAVIAEVAITDELIAELLNENTHTVVYVDNADLEELSDATAHHYDYISNQTLYCIVDGYPLYETESEELCLASSVPDHLECQLWKSLELD